MGCFSNAATRILALVSLLGCMAATAWADTYSSQILSDHPAGYWRLGEPIGSTTAVDSSGNQQNGTYYGGVILGIAGALTSSTDTAAQFDPTFDRIEAELHTQYLLAYAPDPPPAPGSYRHIEVRLAPGYGGLGWTVRARAGYFAHREAAHP